MNADERKALRERAEATIAWRDRGLAAPAWYPLNEREVLALLDALEAAEARAAEVAELLGDIATLADFVDDEISNDARCPMCGRKGRHEDDCHYVTLAARARGLL